MDEDPSKTVRIKRDSRVAEDTRGRNVWVGRVEEAAGLELVSTTALEKVLKSGDANAKVEIRKLAAGGRNGLLARDAATGHYAIIDEEQLKRIAASGDAPPAERPRGVNVAAPLTQDAVQKAEELSLVNTTMLRRVVGPDGKAELVSPGQEKPKKPDHPGRDKFGGFDPYNKS